MVTEVEIQEVVFIVLIKHSFKTYEVIGVFKTYVSAMDYAQTQDGYIVIQEWNLR